MVKKTKKQELHFPEVRNWLPFVPKDKSELDKNEDNEECEKVDIPKDWKEPIFRPEDNPFGRLFTETEFKILYPVYREKYLNEIWPSLKKLMLEHQLKVDLNLADSNMIVKTTSKTFDPFIILKARDVLKMLARSVPLEEAMKLLDNEIFGEVTEIKLANKEKFIKRRNRLIGDEGETLKAIELATGCYVLVQGKTVASIGPYDGVRQVQKLVTDCMFNNIHPVYSLKRIIIQRKIMVDPEKKDLSWDAYLPNMKKKTLSKRKKPHKVRKKKDYTPYPPPVEKSKVDIALETGTYFLSKGEQKEMEINSKIRKSKDVSRKLQIEKRSRAFEPLQKKQKDK